jgi:hypothetical protein
VGLAGDRDFNGRRFARELDRKPFGTALVFGIFDLIVLERVLFGDN